jgi:hypothetical protein
MLPVPANRFSGGSDVASQGEVETLGDSFVDAKTLPGMTIENVIPEVCRSMRCENAFSSTDAQMRKEIATTLLITMGKDILHFEKQIDPATGIVDVDWMFVPDPNASTKSGDNVKIKSHAVMRVYSSHVHPETGSKYSYLLGCEAIDLAALMQHTIHVNSGMVNPEKDHEYDFALRTNFCNTFVVCTVLPTPGGCNVHAIQQQLDLLRTSLNAYAEEESLAQKQGRDADHSKNNFMPSVLRFFCPFFFC